MRLLTLCIFAFILLISCDSSNDSSTNTSSIYYVKVIDSLTNQPVTDAQIMLYYNLEASYSYDSIGGIISKATIKNAILYPNPTMNYLKVNFNLMQTGNVRIELNDYNSKSCISKIVDTNDMPKGTYSYNIPQSTLADLSSGIHLISIFVNDSLAFSDKFLYVPNHFIGYFDGNIGKPYRTVYTNPYGIAEFDLNEFKNINHNILMSDFNGRALRFLKISNGCYIIIGRNNKIVAEHIFSPSYYHYINNTIYIKV